MTIQAAYLATETAIQCFGRMTVNGAIKKASLRPEDKPCTFRNLPKVTLDLGRWLLCFQIEDDLCGRPILSYLESFIEPLEGKPVRN